jgi:hypothetical protein
MGSKVDDLIKDPRQFFAKLFGVSRIYVERAHALLKDDPLATAAVKAGAPLKEKYEALRRWCRLRS